MQYQITKLGANILQLPEDTVIEGRATNPNPKFWQLVPEDGEGEDEDGYSLSDWKQDDYNEMAEQAQYE